MKTLNRTLLIGNVKLKQEPIELKDGKQLYPLIITTDYSYKNRSGESKYFEEDNYVVFWNNLGSIAFSRINEGDLIFVEGRLQTRFWNNDNGEVCHEVNILGERFIVLNSTINKIYK